MWFNFWDGNLDELDDESWISWKTVIFTGVLLFGSGYLLRNFAYVVDEVNDATSDDEKNN